MKSEFWRHPARHVTNAIRRSLSSRVLASSALFDADWYLTQYPDGAIKGMSPARHYLLYGAAEGRNPSPRFDGNWYLKQNPDVVRLGMNPLMHYALHGRKQGREIRPSAQADFQRSITGEKTGSGEGQLARPGDGSQSDLIRWRFER